jgi:hypothetical protein
MAKLPITTWSRVSFSTNGDALYTRTRCRIAGVGGDAGARERVRDIALADGSTAPDAPIEQADVWSDLQTLGIEASGYVEFVGADDGWTVAGLPTVPSAGMLSALAVLFDDVQE